MASNPEQFEPDRDVDTNVVDLDTARANRTRPEPGPGDILILDADDYADVEDEGPVLVDSADAQREPRYTLAGLRGGRRQAIVPAWLRSRSDFADTGKWAAGYAAHTFLYHLTRTPKYAGKLVIRSPRGFGRIVGGFTRWALDLEAEPVRQAVVRTENAETYLKLSKQRDRRVRWRGIVALTTLGTLLAGGITLWLSPDWTHWAALGAVVAVCGVVGRPADKPLLDTAVVASRIAKLTSDVVTRALTYLSIAGINQAVTKRGPKAIEFVAPITRDGPGWRADIDLPNGVTAAEVIDKRDKLAAALGRPLGCVWPETVHDVHPGRLMLWVGDQDMATARQPAWPLLKGGTVDLFKPFPFGTNPRGQSVGMELLYTNLLIGSLPGAGKTFALRVPMLAAALDPRAEIQAFNLKGTSDLKMFAKIASRYATGNDDETVELALLALRDLRKECGRRQKVIAGLPDVECPESKVTPELASRKALGLHPLLLVIDECQELFSHPDFGKEAGELAEKIVKLGRALGVMLLLATQRPDAKSLPTGVSANMGTRFCLRVMGQMENDMILGTSMYKNGVNAAMFTKKDKGLGYLVGASDDPEITKTYYVANPAAAAIIERAYAARLKAGTLTGHAAGDVAESPADRDTLLVDILSVVPAGEEKVWSETVVTRLAERNPDVYGGWTAKHLAAALEPFDIDTGQVWVTDPQTGKGANRKGILRAHVFEKYTERKRRPEAS